MGKHFDEAYEYAMAKIAEFDIDDEEDRRAYARFNRLPTASSHIKRISSNYQDTADSSKKFAIGSGIGALGAGALAAVSKKARPIALPVAIGAGAASGLGALVSASNRSAKRRYDRGGDEYRRSVNLDDYMERHGSQYGGRRATAQANEKAADDLYNAWLIADAIRDSNRRY